VSKLSCSTDLVRRAKALDLDVSRIIERALENAITSAERARGLEDNRAAIAEYNAFVEDHGYLGADLTARRGAG
jgi:antitoxin CcdA